MSTNYVGELTVKYLMSSFVLLILVTAVTSFHRSGTEILKGMAEEYSLCAETNRCSNDEVFEMARIYIVEVDDHWHPANLYLNAFLLKYNLGLVAFSREMAGAPSVFPESN